MPNVYVLPWYLLCCREIFAGFVKAFDKSVKDTCPACKNQCAFVDVGHDGGHLVWRLCSECAESCSPITTMIYQLHIEMKDPI